MTDYVVHAAVKEYALYAYRDNAPPEDQYERRAPYLMGFKLIPMSRGIAHIYGAEGVMPPGVRRALARKVLSMQIHTLYADRGGELVQINVARMARGEGDQAIERVGVG